MGEPAELSDDERDRVLKLAKRIVEAVVEDSGTPLGRINASALARGIPLDTLLLQMAQELIRLNEIQRAGDPSRS